MGGPIEQPDDGVEPVPPKVIDHQMLDEIFGDVLPDTTGDERDAGSGGSSYSEQWYRENTPPHHG